MQKLRPVQVASNPRARAFRALEAATNDRNEAERARESVLEMLSEEGDLRATSSILSDLNRQISAADRRAHNAQQRLCRMADFGIPSTIDIGAAQ